MYEFNDKPDAKHPWTSKMSETKWYDYGLPCPCGKSSDAYAIDLEGDGFCFSCKEYFKDRTTELSRSSAFDKDSVVNEAIDEVSENIEFEYYPHRRISKRTFEFYDIKTVMKDNLPYQTGFEYPGKGVKIRNHKFTKPRDKWFTKGDLKSPGLYGRDKFDPGSKEFIVICEGMYDAPSVYEMLRGKSVAPVSVTSSGMARRDCIQDWEYINSFKKIVLAFDNDDAGREATKAVAPLFDFNKVYQLRMEKRKDPTEYLENYEDKEFCDLFEAARRFAPDNIISSFHEIKAALHDSNENMICDYPFQGLNNSLYGLFEQEYVVVKAPEGVGKSSLFRAIEYHILKKTDYNIGLIHLEENSATTIKGLVSYELRENLVLPDNSTSEDEIFKGFKDLVQNNESRVHIYTSYDVEDEQGFLDNIRFMATAGGCKVIFFDHITWLATGQADDNDGAERKKLDRISQKLKLLAKELNICIILISHINDAGQTRGSRNITKVADTVISISRDMLSENPETRNILAFMVEKARLSAKTGPSGHAIYDRDTGTLNDPAFKSDNNLKGIKI